MGNIKNVPLSGMAVFFYGTAQKYRTIITTKRNVFHGGNTHVTDIGTLRI